MAASLLGSLFSRATRSRTATEAGCTVDEVSAVRERLAAPVLAVQRGAVPLTFASGAEMFSFAQARMQTCMKGQAVQMAVTDDFLEWNRTGGSYAAHAFFRRKCPAWETPEKYAADGTQYVIVGIQASVMAFAQVLLPLFGAAARYQTGSFTLLLHKLTSDVRALVLPSTSRKSDLQAMRALGHNAAAASLTRKFCI